MITALLVWLVKQYLLPTKKNHREQQKNKDVPVKAAGIFILILLPAFSSVAQQQTYHYKVMYKSNNIGNMYLTQIQNGDELSLKVTSSVHMQMLMRINVQVAEEAAYKQDKLIYSSVYRQVNGKQKVNRQTKYCGNYYELIAKGEKYILNKTHISYNLVKLYCKEPVNIAQVYSDAFQQLLSIKPVGAHQYKLVLPEGKYNVYSYKNGICNLVEVHAPFYTVQMLLVE